MSQANNWGVPVVGPVTPDVMAQRIVDSFNAGLSAHSGPSRPSYAVAGTLWMDPSTAGLQKLYQYDGSDDRLLLTIDTASGKVTFAGTVNLSRVSVVTASDAAWAFQEGTKFALIEVQGAGGAGGGAVPNGSTTAAVGSGGSAGAYASLYVDVSAISTANITIGAKGQRDAGGGNGGAGGSTTYSDGTNTLTAPGGGGGLASTGQDYGVLAASSGLSAVATGGDLNLKGGPGHAGLAMGHTTMGTNRSTVIGGHGASTRFGGGGEGGVVSRSTVAAGEGGTDASGYGAGGGGAARCGDTNSNGGGNGTDGVVIIWEYN
jgi:hypothetical protein